MGPASPTLDPNDASYQNEYFTGQPDYQAGWIDNDSTQAQFDYNFPVFIATNADPTVKLHCTANFGSDGCGSEGDLVHVPANATQAGGSDHHLVLIEPGSTLEYDMWGVQSSPPYSSGQTLSFEWGNKVRLDGKPIVRTQPCQARNDCSDIAAGFMYGGATAGNEALLPAQVYISELARGSINHALYVVANCVGGTPVFPASIPDNHCMNNEGFPFGTRLWYDLSDAQVAALPNLNGDEKTILRAMHHYGAFVIDIGGCRGSSCAPNNGLGSHFENQEPYWTYGAGVDPTVAYAMSHGWQHVVSGAVNRWSLDLNGPTIDFLHHLHVVAPCVTLRTC
jgi:hypothetical protein